MVAAVALTTACSGSPSPYTRPTPTRTVSAPVDTTSWTRAAPMPLSPRYVSAIAWTGTEALVVGGYDDTYVGLPKSGPTLRDGAADDPREDSWRRIAPAPEPLDTRHLVTVGHEVVFVQDRRWLAYDVDTDHWRSLPSPPGGIDQRTLTADAATHRVYALDPYLREADTPVELLDLTDDSWSHLPRSRHRPRLDFRTIAMTDAGLVVVGDSTRPRDTAEGHHRQTARAELWDGRHWHRFADSAVNGAGWYWTGHRLIAASLQTAHGPDHFNDYTAGALDPRSGTWSTLPLLPNAPPDGSAAVGTELRGTDGPSVLQDGYLYDDRSRRVTPVRADPVPVEHVGGLAMGAGRLMSFGGYRAQPDTDTDTDGPSDDHGPMTGGSITVTPTDETWVLALPDLQ